MNIRLFSFLLFYLYATFSPTTVFAEGETGWLAYKNVEQWRHALNDGDIERLVKLFTDDALIVRSDRQIKAPSGEFKTWFASLLHNGNIDASIEIVDYHGDNNLIIATTKWVLTDTTPEVVNNNFVGTVVNVFERQGDGNWKTRLQSWN